MYNEEKLNNINFRILISLAFFLCFNFLFLSGAYAEQAKQKTLLEQLEEEERKERTSNIHQGPSKPAAQTLQNARNNAQANTNSCPQGSNRRKIEDVKEYIAKQEDFQIKVAASLERFTSRLIERNQAVNEFNSLINQSNEIVIWGRGKVTDGACGSVAQTEIIGKAYGASKLLIDDYRKLLTPK
jgi:hypothetical protein